MGETMTVRDVIEVTRRELSQVMIPAALVKEIGIPVSNALHNLEMCLEAIDREMAKAEEPVIELFAGDEKVGEVPAEEEQDK